MAIRLPSKEQIEAERKAELDFLRPLAGDIGILVYAWNHLHREFYRLFLKLMDGAPEHTASAIWHSLDSDRSQRKALDAIAGLVIPDKHPLKVEVLWLIGEVGDLAVYRNDLVHAPFTIDSYPGPEPDWRYGSRQTTRLSLKPDLKQHISEATEYFERLAWLARYFLWHVPEIGKHWEKPRPSLQRPTRPPSLCKPNQQQKTHPPKGQAAPHPPGSSLRSETPGDF